MKTIYQNADHLAATAQLAELMQAHATALAEEASLMAQLADLPASKPSALDLAKSMLKNGTPAPRLDHGGLNSRLTTCRESLALLAAAIAEQRGIIAGLIQAQSAIVNSERKASHIEAAQAIKTALAGLRAALEAEQGLRAEIAAGGYQCSLEPLARPALDFSDTQATISQFARDVDHFLMVAELTASKALNVRMLCGKDDSLPGDVLTLTGHEAAALVRNGRAEPTRDKPSRTPRPVRESIGQTMATALS